MNGPAPDRPGSRIAEPPPVGRWLLLHLLPVEVRSWTTDDIGERYRRLVRNFGRWSAWRWYWTQVGHAAALAVWPRRRASSWNSPGDGRRRDTPMGMVQQVAHDVAFGFRQQRQHPLLTVLTVLTLGIGIGGNVAIYTVLNQVLFRPFPYANADHLAMLWHPAGRSRMTWISFAEYLDYRAMLTSADDVAAVDLLSANLTGGGEPERVPSARVTANMLDVLGVKPILGRAFSPEEARPGGERVVVLTSELFRRRFAADPDLLGNTILVNDQAHTVVGILPAGVRLPVQYGDDRPAEVWLPLRIDPQNLPGRGDRGLHAVVRLRDEVTPEVTSRELNVLHARWHEEGLLPETIEDRAVVPLREFVFGDVRPMVVVVFAAAGFVLLIACANVANLLLARGEARRREVGVRTALGASRRRIIQQWLTESIEVAAVGGGLGLAVGAAGTQALRSWGPAEVPRLSETTMDAKVLVFTLVATLVTGIVFGLLPALQASRVDPQRALQGGGRGDTERTGALRARRALVVTELALAAALAIGSVLTVRSFLRLRSIDLGFDARGTVTARLELPEARYPDPASMATFYDDVVQRVAELPEVAAVGAARIVPLSRTIGDWSITIENYDAAPGENPNGDWQIVVPGYFEAMRIPLVQGRYLRDTDRADQPPAVVISETMARRYWPGGDAIGKRFRLGNDPRRPWHTIVGIVGDVKHNGLTEMPRAEMYHPVSQWARVTGFAPGMTVVVRTAGEPRAVLGRVREIVRAMDPRLPVSDVRTMDDIVAAAASDTRFAMALLNVFALVAVLLAAVGIYGVISYTVNSREREIGIRMAMGASRSQVIRYVLGEMVAVVIGGLVLGAAVAGAVTRLMTTLLYDVSPWDPMAFGLVVTVLGVVGLVAAYLPARRAAAINPAVAFRG